MDEPSWAAPRQPPSPWAPTLKVKSAAGTAGTVAAITWILGLWGIDLPPTIAVVLAGLLTTGAAYLIPEPGRHRADKILWRRDDG